MRRPKASEAIEAPCWPEAATAEVQLLQFRQRPAPAGPCANRVVTTRRQPVVTTLEMPQRTRAYTGLPHVTAPSDELKARRIRRPCNAICPTRLTHPEPWGNGST